MKKEDFGIIVESQYEHKCSAFKEGDDKCWHELVERQYYLVLQGSKIPISEMSALTIQTFLYKEKRNLENEQ